MHSSAARRANHGDAYSDDEDEEERRASEKEADEQLQVPWSSATTVRSSVC